MKKLIVIILAISLPISVFASDTSEPKHPAYSYTDVSMSLGLTFVSHSDRSDLGGLTVIDTESDLAESIVVGFDFGYLAASNAVAQAGFGTRFDLSITIADDYQNFGTWMFNGALGADVNFYMTKNFSFNLFIGLGASTFVFGENWCFGIGPAFDIAFAFKTPTYLSFKVGVEVSVFFDFSSYGCQTIYLSPYLAASFYIPSNK